MPETTKRSSVAKVYCPLGAADTYIPNYRKHIKPQFSQTILLPNVYNNPGHTPEGQNMSAEELQADFDRFYEDFFM